MNKLTLSLCIGALQFGAYAAARGDDATLLPPASLEAHRPQLDRSRLPAALQNVPLERLSSGALWRLDQGGDIVRAPEPDSAQAGKANKPDAAEQTQAVALDPRVSPNVRLGDDPPQLPQNFRSQAEPHITRAPSDANFLLATFQEGRFTGGGAVTCGYSVSRDGGFTWTRALIPHLATINGGTYDRATDPVAGVASDGAAYLNTLGLRNGTVPDGTVLVSRSNNFGANWFPPVIAYKPPNTDLFPDKNWMAINTFPGSPNAGRMVVTFTNFSNTGGLSHPIMRVLSDDGGSTWSAAAPVHSTNIQVQGSQPVYTPDGKLAIVYWNFNNTGTFADDFLEVVTSPDGGGTFTTPRVITPVNIYDHPSIRDGAFLPSATGDRTTNTIYVAYQAVHNGSPRIMFTKSPDGGINWTSPIPISDNPNGSGVFNAAIAASPDGKVLTTVFYDVRDNPGSTTLVDMYMAQSFDGGNTWLPNVRLSSDSTNAALAPNTGPAANPAYMLGDYQAIAGATADPNVPAVPVWIDTRAGNPDPFVTRVRIAPSSVAKADFNADGQADFVWQNTQTGERVIWFLKNGQYQSGIFLPTIAPEWRIASAGDFNADGHADFVWQNVSNGERVIWFLRNGQYTSGIFLPTIAREWEIASAADFNADGQADFVWQNTQTGERVIWFLRNGQYQSGIYLQTIAPEWRIAGAADFNKDGYADFAWQNIITGERVMWFLRDGQYIGGLYMETIPPDWRIAATADFNLDGYGDFAWQNINTGERVMWFLRNGIFQGGIFLPTIDRAWDIADH